MKTVDIIERIEGEAKLVCQWDNNRIKDARIEFLNFRGFEYILENKAPLDALVYTPRICGICGQAHLKATVEALEDIYKNIGAELKVTKKAKLLREIGLNIEIIDSHIKWFYMFIMPDMIKLSKRDFSSYEPLHGEKWLKGLSTASETIKALAVIGGQWPHTSYMIPGGVVSDPTLFDLTTMNNYLDSAINFFEKQFVGVDFETYLSFSKIDELTNIKGDFKDFIDLCYENNFNEIGRSHNRHIVLSSSSLFKMGKVNKRLTNKIDFERIEENSDYTFNVDKNLQNSNSYTWSKSVKYGNNFYETGPLSRAVVSKREFLSALYENYQDSVLVRVMARMDELAHLLYNTKKLIKEINISEESATKVSYSLNDINSAEGQGVVEASRGSLYHKVTIEEGKIQKYDVITPTVWNLGPGSLDNQSIAQKAIIGLDSIEKAQIVLRSFDVCSVCTTH
ncbi:nickel-dependent hydrogenase large subunit [Halarcobacter ebronensis]|uniref:Ni/Fe hydrogenase n=1 Tax=Halarcobacter ebronensis TaxID=1462615 RepID=A0A4Q1AL85_9BACT|nr:nickel-dependent hydrogenase large subunit [Halarcobacter ebronensis]QKF81629.1 [Ni-Fe] hydrogenase, large subunit [Halarcobacter ebronensis]RXK05554.1 Ni/Fe hydrogenase [Halarcobacter ebronensis]